MKISTKEMPEITLYHYNTSPYGAKILTALQYKKLPFSIYYLNPLRIKKDLPVGTQIPVLRVGSEVKNDSTPICLWLDELFPDSPRLIPEDPEERKKVLALDSWASHRLLSNVFRSYPGDGMDFLVNSWKLGHVMNQTCHGGLPSGLRYFWPVMVKSMKFARDMVAMTDTHLPVAVAKEVIYQEFMSRLEGGPFLGGREQPSLPDFACYPNFLMFYLMGFRKGDDILKHPGIINWMHRVRPFVEGAKPALIPSVCVNNEFPTLDSPSPFSSSFFPSFSPSCY